jgi:NAD(P)-dependent dehydrogenase (short-subunit alcohol dehydrogenase family)
MTRFSSEKVALIVGASAGIGRQTALAFAQSGARVMLAGRREQELKQLASQIAAQGGEAAYQSTDVTRATDVEQLVNETITRFGRLDYAFNNAGILRSGPFTSLSERDWEDVIAVNLKGVWLSMKYEIPAMLATEGGAIVNMASVGGLVGTAGNSIYAASKGGVIAMSRAAAMEFVSQNIRINIICPGVVATELFMTLPEERQQQLLARHPIGRAGTPEEIASAVVWLCSDEASFIVGHTMILDGGVTAQ